MKWELGKINKVKHCKNPKLYTSDVIHAYKDLDLGLLLNPIIDNILYPILYEVEGDIVVEDFGTAGCFSLTPIKELDYSEPEWYQNIEIREKVQIQFAILCAESITNFWIEICPNDDRLKRRFEASKNYIKTNAIAAYDIVRIVCPYACAYDYRIDFISLAKSAISAVLK